MKKLIIANWKMNKTSSEVVSWFTEFSTFLPSIDFSQVTIAIAPPFPYLELSSNLKQVSSFAHKTSVYLKTVLRPPKLVLRR